MKNPVQEYKGNEIIVRYDPKVCIHAAECVKRLPQVFDIKEDVLTFERLP